MLTTSIVCFCHLSWPFMTLAWWDLLQVMTTVAFLSWALPQPLIPKPWSLQWGFYSLSNPLQTTFVSPAFLGSWQRIEACQQQTLKSKVPAGMQHINLLEQQAVSPPLNASLPRYGAGMLRWGTWHLTSAGRVHSCSAAPLKLAETPVFSEGSPRPGFWEKGCQHGVYERSLTWQMVAPYPLIQYMRFHRAVCISDTFPEAALCSSLQKISPFYILKPPLRHKEKIEPYFNTLSNNLFKIKHTLSIVYYIRTEK